MASFTNEFVAALDCAIESMKNLEDLGKQMRIIREQEIADQDQLNKAARFLAAELGIEPGRNKVIVHNGAVYNLDNYSSRAQLTRIESVTV